jgi:fido (protein-threonine AMPylation protein)
MYSSVQTLAQYEEAVIKGTGDAVVFLGTIDTFFPLSVPDLQAVHYHLFKHVHPWAGQFRAPGQMATIAGYPAADPARIQRELELALHQTRQLMASALGDRLQMLAAISFFHVRYERIHPFLDGNGRSGRSVLAVQFEKLFGHLPDFSNQQGYRFAIRESASGDLGPFLRYLGPGTGMKIPSGAWASAYRVSPRFLDTADGSPTFEEDLQWSMRRA